MSSSSRSTLLVVGVRKLGRNLALHFAQQGWRVICAARSSSSVQQLARAVDAAGGAGEALTCDLTEPSTLLPLQQEPIDLCIAAQASGVRFGPKPLLEIDGTEIDRSYATMVRGTWNLMQAVGPAMNSRGSGTLLQIGTSSGVRTREGYAGLAAVHQGLRGLVQVAAREWRSRGVHVAYVVVDGPIASDATRSGGFDPSRVIEPAEIARACQYLHEQQPCAWTHEMLLRPAAGEWTAPT